MSKKQTTSIQDNDQQFWELAEQFIEMANQSLETADAGKIGAAMLFAATRFNAFVVASASIDRAEFAADMDESMDYLSKQFRHMLGDNLRDFRDNYKVYIKHEQQPE
ncbi:MULTISPECIES: DUF3144 domain-containing protein [Thiothrix]|jgi:hypothetical protein|uniref:DUF3144 domain-containing protein n=3 Tax=Thiothrix TaxID=1030 RepID=A0A975IIQ0_9GAMM|nr:MULTISPECIES: DUF3144 domain-containing protein [Thiothrix]MDX9988968.1 DUF3144 domain-containing protein [Thiothrix unzii]OQX08907.1 MAG: hypothetical protein BWK73_24075 [Thiothrix lacustris]QTR49029.1 DUF3144 domain-containing protein [Candidatus Thiothrix anitrata]QTR54918.1 DUF3144 domain-containing protein [Thiothrix unzii]